MSTNHLPLSTAMLLVLVRWMLPIVNKQKLDEKGPVNETKMTAALQRVIGKEPTFDDLQDIERGNVVTNFDRVGIEIPDNVAGLIVDFLASWTPELPHCNQPHCGLPSLVARGKRLDKSMKPGDVCPHCNAGTLTVTVRNDLILNWVVGSMVPKDQRFHNLTGMQVPIQEADLRGETAPGLLAMLDQKEVSIGKFLRYLLVDARHSVPNVRGEAVACLEAIGPTGVIVRRFAGFALGGLVDQAKAMVEGTVVKKVETGTGANEPLTPLLTLDDTRQVPGPELRTICMAIEDAFQDESSLARVVRYGLDKNLNAIAPGYNVLNLVTYAKSRGELGELLRAMRKENSGNATLAAATRPYGF